MKPLVVVRCPDCGQTMKSQTLKNKVCVYCGYRFSIYPKNEPSRVVSRLVDEGTLFKEYQRQIAIKRKKQEV